jgi:hypothetical protein
MIHSQFFFNRCFDKGKLKGLISWSLRNYGEATTLDLVEKLKDVGFLWATKAGISLSIDDLKIPKEKRLLLLDAEELSSRTSQQFLSGNLTTVERLQQLIDTWHRTSENLKQEVVSNFRRTDPLNPVYMMAFSGARGNISQVRQLVGMRGLMADPQGRIIDFPIRSNFREGLTLTEYVISCYGARKGIVDTALRTATSGYLTRRLVDVAQHVVVSLYDCETKHGIPLTALKQGAKTILPLSERILGRVLAEDVPGVAVRNTCISEYLSYELANTQDVIIVRSPLLCKSRNGVCQLCYGWSLAHNELVSIGEAVGIIAAQSIGEPGTQLTMRTFHTGGVFSGEIIDQVQTPIAGCIKFSKPLKGSLVRTSYGKIGFLTREAGVVSVISENETNRRKELAFPIQSVLFVRQGQTVEENEILFEYAASGTDQDQGIQSTQLVLSPQKGEVFFEDVTVLKDDLNIEVQAYQLGSFWLLTSHLHAQVVNTIGYFNYLKGDLVLQNSSISSTKLFNVSNDISTLESENISKFDLNLKRPNILFKISDVFTNQVLYKQGNYLSSISLNSYSPIKFSSSNKSLFGLINNRFISLIGFSNSLRKKFVDGNQISPALTILLSSSRFWFFTTKVKSPLSTNYSKIKSLNFVETKQNVVCSANSSIQKKTKKTGTYSFKSCQKRKEVIVNSVKKFYLTNSDTDGISWNTQNEIWKIKVSNISFTPKNSVKSLFSISKFSENTSTYFLNKVFYRPVFNQIPQYFFTSLITNRQALASSIFELILEDKQNLLKLIPLMSKTSCLYSFSSILNLLTNSTGIVNKQSIDKSLFTPSSIEFQYQAICNSENKHFVAFQLQPNVSIDRINWAFPEQSPFKLTLVGRSQILLPDRSNRAGKKREFEWGVSKRKIVDNHFILAQLDKKAIETFEVFKFLKTIQGNKVLSLNQKDLVGNFFTSTKTNYFREYLGALIRPGTELLKGKTSKHSGQIVSIRKNSVLLRQATPILFSSKATFHVFHGDFIEKGLPLITLVYKRLTTGDIVQGIPRIEQLFEARQTTTLLHDQLHELFETYKTRMRLDLAARKSFYKIQRILIDSIQRVYQSQGVTISDKHLEVIVRQMTSTVRILEGGRTRLLRGELKPIDWIEKINLGIDIQKAEYEPILLGITKASLETESFISAASFQETTRTLSRAAIEGRTDFLRGLKENVILGHRVPAGTGAPLISYLTKFSTNSELQKDMSSELNFLLKE